MRSVIFSFSLLFLSYVQLQAQLIQAEYYWDVDPGAGNGIPILALDGSLNEEIESVFKEISSFPSPGVHTFNVRVKDSLSWGTVYTTIVNVEDSIIVHSGKVLQAEYYWDVDPGAGNGMALLALDGNLDEAIEEVFKDISNLPPSGLHAFNIRLKDSLNWGNVYTTVISIEDSVIVQPGKVLQAEYYWDVDPGAGNGTTLLALDGSLDEAIEEVFKNISSLPLSGVHAFNIRLKDSLNWGNVYTTVVSVEDSVIVQPGKVLQAEYYWDVDPGAGNGIALLALDGNLDEAIEKVFKDISNLPPSGLHAFNIRLKDSLNWGNVYTTVISIEDSVIVQSGKVLQAEYYWDIDPGAGNGTALLALDGKLDETIEGVFKNVTSLPPSGLHTFNIRLKDSLSWGTVYTTVVNIEDTVIVQSGKLLQAEYYWDVDPGAGNGMALLALDGKLDEAIEGVFKNTTNLPASGLHTFNIRLKDSLNWGLVYTTVVNIEDSFIVDPGKILQAEYYWDADPGEGNGTALFAMDGSLDEAIEMVIDSSVATFGLSLGLHALSVRMKDKNEWGPSYTVVVDIDTSLTPLITKISGDSTFCANNNVSGKIYTVLQEPGVTYQWSISGGSIISGNGNSSILVDWDTSATSFFLSVEGTNSHGKGNLFTKEIVINSIPEVSFISDTFLLCEGENVLIFPQETFETYLWSNGETNSFISATSPGAYFLEVIDSLGCENTSENIIVLEKSSPKPDLGNDTLICNDTGIALISLTTKKNYSSYLWSNGDTSSTRIVNATGTYKITVTDDFGCEGTDIVQVEMRVQPSLNLGTDTMVCDQTALYPGVYDQYQWSTGSIQDSIFINQSGDYYLKVTDINGCNAHDTINIVVNSSPNIDLGSDTSICGDASFLSLNPGEGYHSYQWSNGSADSVISVATTGNYSVAVSSINGCIATDSIEITFATALNLDLGADTSVCGDFVIHAGIYDAYNWSTGQSADTIIATQSGTYHLTVSDTNGCSDVDTIDLEINDLPNVDLGSDTSVCGDISFLSLNPGEGYSSYHWNNGSTDSIISVTTTGNYSVTVSSLNGCTAADSIQINFAAALDLDLGADTSACGDFVIHAGIYDAYNWSTGQSTDTIIATQSGTYHLTVSDHNGCSDVDTINLEINDLPNVDLGSDASFCKSSGDGTILEADTGFVSYLWNTGANSSSIFVSTSGAYSVIVSDKNGCSSSDTVNYTLHLLPNVDLGADVEKCSDSTKLIAPTGMSQYMWSTGATSSDIQASLSGNYSVTVTNTDGCSNSDTVNVKLHTPLIVDLGPNITACENDSVELSYVHPDVESYLWSTGDKDHKISPTVSGTYFLTITDKNGCSSSGEIIANIVSLPEASFIPIVNGSNLITTNTSSEGEEYNWFFGDGNSSEDFEPTHAYNTAGSFKITLLVKNQCGVDTTSTSVSVDAVITGNEELTSLQDVSVFPNPSTGKLNLDFGSPLKETLYLSVTGYDGKLVYKHGITKGNNNYQFELNNCAPGVYMLCVASESRLIQDMSTLLQK